MTLRKRLGISLVIQIIGSLATFLAVIFITRIYGPVGQGYISYFRSTVDLVVSIGAFGLPQALVYMINSEKITVGWALKFSAYYSGIFTFVASCAGVVLYTIGIAQERGFDGFAVACAVLASSGLLAHGLYRVIALVTSSASVFNLVTILPSMLTLIFYVLAAPAVYSEIVIVHAVASILSLIAVVSLFVKIRWSGNSVQGAGIILKSASLYGFWSFIPHMSLALTTVVTYSLLRQGPGADAVVGQFSVAVLLVSTVLLPINMVVPILFNAWSSCDAENMRRASFMKLAHVGTFLSFFGLTLGLALAGPLTMLLFGRELMPSVPATQIILVSIFAMYQNRLSAALLLSLGKPNFVAVSAAIRMIVIVTLLLQGLTQSITTAALAWVIGEFAAFVYLIFKVVQLTGWPVFMTLGLSPGWVLVNIRAVRK